MFRSCLHNPKDSSPPHKKYYPETMHVFKGIQFQSCYGLFIVYYKNWDIMGNYFVGWAKPIKMETVFLYKRLEQIINNVNNSVKWDKTQLRRIFQILREWLNVSFLLLTLKFAFMNLIPCKLCVSKQKEQSWRSAFIWKFLRFLQTERMVIFHELHGPSEWGNLWGLRHLITNSGSPKKPLSIWTL